ncbi:transcription factor S [Candidatus Micrarchaeota archaeon RBG_16_49_10]|nr:MAG: transcription factor S [Candidatus Micrarchaeota archaeon RBG_16_49_10]
MKFCDKCGNLMIFTEKGKASGYLCRNCGHFAKAEEGESTMLAEDVDGGAEEVKVIGKDDDYKQYPKSKIDCPNCGHGEAYWYMQQTRGADEPQTRFYSCVKCKHKWREYD